MSTLIIWRGASFRFVAGGTQRAALVTCGRAVVPACLAAGAEADDYDAVAPPLGLHRRRLGGNVSSFVSPRVARRIDECYARSGGMLGDGSGTTMPARVARTPI